MLTILAGLVFLVLVVYTLALFDIFFTFCPEGQIKVIVKGKSYHNFVHSVSGWKKNSRKLVPLEASDKEDRRGFFGLFWVGIWPIYRIYWYKFEWETIVGGLIVKRSRWVNTIIFRFEYPLEFKGLETSDNFKMTVVMQVLTEAFCPELALFKARNWLNVVKASIESKVRDFIGQYSFEQIRGSETEIAARKLDFVKQIIDLSKQSQNDANPSLEDIVGVGIRSANFQRIDPEDDRVVKALELVGIAEREGDARIKAAAKDVEVATKKAEARIKEADGEEYYIRHTTLVVAENERATGIEEIRSLPKNLTTLVQRGAANVSVGGEKK